MKIKKIYPCVIGLGYVGLPLFLQIQKKFETIGFDINKQRIKQLNNKFDINNEFKKKNLIKQNSSKFVYELRKIKKCNFYIICVPTPLKNKNIPNLDSIKKSCILIGKVLNKDDIVFLESTVYPGVTEKVCAPIIEKVSKLKKNIDFHIGYSPERINPGDNVHKVNKIKKIVSCKTRNLTIKSIILKIYKSVTKKIIYSKKIQETETAKLIENIQRDLNIALMNEIYLACEKLKINFFEVKRLAETKWNFKKFSPGMVGGHCLPVDPYYFTYLMKKNNFKTKIISAGRDINNNIYKFVEKKIIEKINILGKNINNSKILLMGLAYKENISDIRNSISLKIFKILKMKYAGIYAYDPHLHNKKNQISNSLYNLKNKDFDLVVILVNHKIFKRKIYDFKKNNTPILDIFGSLKNN